MISVFSSDVGEQELRPVHVQQRNNHKYTIMDICSYGSRCLFIHPQPINTPPTPADMELEYSKLQLMAMSRCGPASATITAHYQGQVDGSAPLDSLFQLNEAAESMVKFLWA
ncbi:hypothetical protein M3Y98_00588600 [Aphelenchoides besseyi]|nr:hypothetical protein M3Y98_00588600 [Aphelenchoides besseyi]KAI6193952.1 hypothetical protein M3Y96_01073200 [Aphelenchoides besseyi]